MESQGEITTLRCRKCRKGFMDSTSLDPIRAAGDGTTVCNIWHVNVDTLPEWIMTSVYQAHWTVGKLNCPSCGARLGGFNFINHTRCPCGQDTTVHLSKSRVDQDHRSSCHTVQLRRLRAEDGRGHLQGAAGTPTREQERPALGRDIMFASQFCCSVISHVEPDTQTSTTCPVSPHQLIHSRVMASSPNLNPPYRMSHKMCRLDAEASGTCAVLCAPMSTDRACVTGMRAVKEQPTHSSMPYHAARHLNVVVDSALSRDACFTAVTRERWHMAHEQEWSEDGGLMSSGASMACPEEPPDSAMFLRGRTISDSIGESREIPGREEEEPTEEAAVWTHSSELQTHLQPQASSAGPAPNRLSKREKNRLKSQRRKQRRRERWISSQLEQEQNVSGLLTDSEEEDREGYTCAVCLDVYYSPYSCHPCGHVFCEPCLRTLAKNRHTNTPCPLCRTPISHTLFQKELNQTTKTFFPKVYHARKINFQKATCAKWPLPNCRRRFRIFWEYQRQLAAGRRWQFVPPGFTLDALDLADMWVWLFNIDLVIIYIHSVNWILATLLLCFLVYFFFS